MFFSLHFLLVQGSFQGTKQNCEGKGRVLLAVYRATSRGFTSEWLSGRRAGLVHGYHALEQSTLSPAVVAPSLSERAHQPTTGNESSLRYRQGRPCRTCAFLLPPHSAPAHARSKKNEKKRALAELINVHG